MEPPGVPPEPPGAPPAEKQTSEWNLPAYRPKLPHKFRTNIAAEKAGKRTLPSKLPPKLAEWNLPAYFLNIPAYLPQNKKTSERNLPAYRPKLLRTSPTKFAAEKATKRKLPTKPPTPPIQTSAESRGMEPPSVSPEPPGTPPAEKQNKRRSGTSRRTAQNFHANCRQSAAENDDDNDDAADDNDDAAAAAAAADDDDLQYPYNLQYAKASCIVNLLLGFTAGLIFL